MARSSYIYVVKVLSKIIGTFTVKHEMLSDIQRSIDAGQFIAENLSITRHVDGTMDYQVVDITNQFEFAPRGKS